MAIISGLFNSINGDRRYDAVWFARYFATFIGNGVFPNPSTGLQVIEASNMTTTVKPGDGWINGYFIVNDSDHILLHDIADGVLKRIDRVVLRLDFATRQIFVQIKKGTFASTPTAPTLQRDTDAYELALADVLINNGATVITQANITDQRLNSGLCGIVHGTVDQVDTTTIFNQYQSWFGEFTEEKQMDFDVWLESIKDLLDGDIAANLANRIASLEDVVASHKAEMSSQAAGKGASLVGIHDANNNFTATTVEGALNELFTNANSLKTDWANVVGSPLLPDDTSAQLKTKTETIKNNFAASLTSKGVSALGSESLTAMVSKLSNINTGSSKGASGRVAMRGLTFGSSYYSATISGLSFEPKFIYIRGYNAAQILKFQSFVAPVISYNTELKSEGFINRMWIGTITKNASGFTFEVLINMSSYDNVGLVWEYDWVAWD